MHTEQDRDPDKVTEEPAAAAQTAAEAATDETVQHGQAQAAGDERTDELAEGLDPSAVGPDGGEPDDGSEQDPRQLTMLLEDARAKADEAHDKLLRTRAEMENMNRRQAKELENAHKFALEGFVKELLQVRDSLELGYAAAQEPDTNVGKLREGTELTLKLLGDVMSKFGVERVFPEGEPFNPEFHQAMSMQPRADLAPNTVTNVIQSGYLLNGRLVRPALVMVSSQA
jgi:molecular chaperone GrpE